MPVQTQTLRVICALSLTAAFLPGASQAAGEFTLFDKEIQPLLTQYCYDCHGDGASKGKVAFDGFKSHDELLAKRDLWHAVLRNTRAGLMPPEKKPRPTSDEQRRLEAWIKREVFGLDPQNPDPGRVTLRRLNRVEYHNTIRDLMGYDFKVEEELPPDDTGYGFDNIGDVLTVSPMLLEKYMQAAEKIVSAAVPRMGRVAAEKSLLGADGRGAGRGKGNNPQSFSFYETGKVSRTFNAEHAGSYKLALEVEVAGQFEPDPGRCRAVLKVDDREIWRNEFGWEAGKKFNFDFDQNWETGARRLTLELQPLTPVAEKKNSLDLRILALRVQGPFEEQFHVRPRSFDLFFTRDVPNTAAERRDYARDVLRRFATKAFRRPVDERSLDRLVKIAENTYSEAGKRFEDGVAQAMVAVLASPRFLFRVEETEGAASVRERRADAGTPGPEGFGLRQPSGALERGKTSEQPPAQDESARGLAQSRTLRDVVHPFIDEYSLASRLSYFLWATLPDDELFRLAGRGELRQNLAPQVKRLLADPRAQELTENFVGQWLQVRDVEGIDINARVVLARDSGQERDIQRRGQRFQQLRDIPDEKLTPEERKELEDFRAQFRGRQRNRPQIELDRDLRRALRQESELYFAHIVREDRSVLELLDSDYTFLNEKLAKHYGITNVIGPEMRRVSLAADSPRGGVLTHGSALIVTSNPTRTSPVKRGLFILDNILGIPTPPPPPDVPNLEDSEKAVAGRQPTLRETLAIHREKPLCASCHNRMDPLGLALENFNALGMWREKERGQTIDATGKLITGEEFKDIREVKKTLVSKHRLEFYRCLTEKLLTYALGRGVEYYDVETVDQIVARLDNAQGRFSALLMGIVESAPFQKRRSASAPGTPDPNPAEQRAESKALP